MFHRRGTESAEMDNIIQHIVRLAGDAQRLACEAERQYSNEVKTILKARSRDSRQIEKCLDSMLNFCFDQGMLELFRKLCRYYFSVDPEGTASYVHA